MQARNQSLYVLFIPRQRAEVSVFKPCQTLSSTVLKHVEQGMPVSADSPRLYISLDDRGECLVVVSDKSWRWKDWNLF